MTPFGMVRVCALAALLSGTAIVASDFIAYGGLQRVLMSASLLLSLIGLLGLYVLQRGEGGWLGRVGLVLAFVGAVPQALAPWVSTRAEPWVGSPPVSVVVFGVALAAAFLLWLVGIGLLGVATVRAEALQPPLRLLPLVIVSLVALSYLLPSAIVATGLPLEASARASIFLSRILHILSGFGWVLLGYALWRQVSEGIRRRPARVE